MDGGALRDLAARAADRTRFWIEFLDETKPTRALEVGVWRGDFAKALLAAVPSIERYYMLDPWRNLEGWNKPANVSDAEFETVMAEALANTDSARDRTEVLRGRTTEVIDRIEDASLDFVYIDGDHTLRGIAVDLARCYPKVRVDGHIGGDDFARNIFQHPLRYEPTMVFPYAVHFAEAMGDPIHGLPHGQFLIEKTAGENFSFTDHTGRFPDTGLRTQIRPLRLFWRRLRGR